ncbi:MAG: YetF domain-containing protein [Bacillus sp. (in: firmicutes)]
MIQPVGGKNIWTTLAVGGTLVLTLIVMEYAQIKSDRIEKLITEKSEILIENGTLNEKNLKKLRFTVDQLEMKLRQQNVTKISDVQWATLEPNGQVGYELKQEAQPVTKKEFQLLQQDIQQVRQLLDSTFAKPIQQQEQPKNQQDIFSEVAMNSHTNKPPKHLQ